MNTVPRLATFTRRLAAGPGWSRSLVLLAFGLAVAALCWWLVLKDLQQALASAVPARAVQETQRMERQAAVEKAQAEVARISAQKDQLTVLGAQAVLAVLANGLPAGSATQGAWAAVHQASRRQGLRMEQFKPGPVVPAPVGSETPHPQQRAALRLSGSFEALLAFTRALAEARSLVGIESYLLIQNGPSAAGDGSGNLSLDATLLSLQQLKTPTAHTAPATASSTASLMSASSAKQGQEAKGPDALSPAASPAPALAAQLPSTPRDPFGRQDGAASSAPEAGATYLISLPLSAMRMVGSVRAADQAAALVLIGGALHAVRVGDALGNARGRVTEIRADGLTVREPGSPGSAQSARVTSLLIVKD